MEDGAVDSDAVDGNGEKIGKRNAPADLLPCDREWNLATDRAGQGDPFAYISQGKPMANLPPHLASLGCMTSVMQLPVSVATGERARGKVSRERELYNRLVA